MASATTALLTALKTYFANVASGPLTNSITGLFWIEQAPGGTATPYCEMSTVGSPTTQKYGGVAFVDPQIQFTVFGVGAAAALTLTDLLIAALDEKVLTLTGHQQITTRRLHDPIPIPPEPNEQGKNVYGWAVTYVFPTA